MEAVKNKFFLFTGLFFLFAGVLHFLLPAFYLPLIPDWLPFPKALNFIAGAAEMMCGIFLFRKPLRRAGALLMFALMVAFVPSHVYFIQMGCCLSESLCVPAWIAWLRLLLIHPLLLWWALYLYRISGK
jgi:uncharacterized membrane protein